MLRGVSGSTPSFPVWASRSRGLALVTSAALASSCGGGTGPAPSADALHVGATGVVITVGDTLRLGATIREGRTTYSTVVPLTAAPWPTRFPARWTSADDRVARTGTDGLVTAAAPGATRVTLEAAGLRDTASVLVRATDDTAGLAARAVSAGAGFTCALTPVGEAACWGSGWAGELGSGVARLFTAVLSAARVAGGLRFTALDAGGQHACGIATEGEAYCWGDDLYGQLGTGRVEVAEAVPARVDGGHRFRVLSAGNALTCGITVDGAVLCWGKAVVRGDGSREPSPAAVALPGPGTFTTVSVGHEHACALRDDGAAYCWGNNVYGQLGAVGASNPSGPTPVAGAHRFRSISAGTAHTCAVDDAGAAFCWGANWDGRLGTGDETASPTPVPVAGGLRFASISAGLGHTCGVTGDGAAYCWGRNAQGELGAGAVPLVAGGDGRSLTPARVDGLAAVDSVTAGPGEHTCAVAGGIVYCWGANGGGALGEGTLYRVATAGGRALRTTPVRAAPLR